MAFAPLKIISGIKIIKGLYRISNIKKELRPTYTLYNDLKKVQFKKGITFAKAWKTLKDAKTVKELLDNLIDIGKLVRDTSGIHFKQFVHDFADLVGVDACVDLILAG